MKSPLAKFNVFLTIILIAVVASSAQSAVATMPLVLDPFLGSGTTAVVAAKLGRYFIGIDVLPENCKLAQDELNGLVLTNSKTKKTVN